MKCAGRLDYACRFDYSCLLVLTYDVNVRLSVTEVLWRIRPIANLGFKFRSKLTAHCGRGEG